MVNFVVANFPARNAYSIAVAGGSPLWIPRCSLFSTSEVEYSRHLGIISDFSDVGFGE